MVVRDVEGEEHSETKGWRLGNGCDTGTVFSGGVWERSGTIEDEEGMVDTEEEDPEGIPVDTERTPGRGGLTRGSAEVGG